MSLFLGISQGLFPHHKLIFAAELCFRGLMEADRLHPALLAFLVRPQVTSPVMESPFKEWLDAPQWQSVVELSQLEILAGEDEQGNAVTEMPFESLQNEIMESSRRFRDWHDLERPEESPLPGDWKKIPEINKLLVIRALRPDRFLPAMSTFVKNEMGTKFLIPRTMKLSKVMPDSSNQVPILFVLTPGVDPVKEVEALGEILEIHYENKKLALVCLGQGQEAVAEATVDAMSADGGWVFLQNLHLLKAWTSGYLEEKVEDLAGAHQDFRLFVSTEPSFAPIATIMASIKLTNEAPDGLKANLLKAMQPFDEEFFEASSSAADLKAIVFGVCVLHAVLVQRKKFGAIGNTPRPTVALYRCIVGVIAGGCVPLFWWCDYRRNAAEAQNYVQADLLMIDRVEPAVPFQFGRPPRMRADSQEADRDERARAVAGSAVYVG